MENQTAKYLYSDKNLNNNLRADFVNKLSDGVVVYMYDGNNGDKHLVTGYTLNNDGGVESVLAVNLSQSYLSGEYSSYKNASDAVKNMLNPKNDLELVKLLRNVRVYSF
jgi:hypothetical protein